MKIYQNISQLLEIYTIVQNYVFINKVQKNINNTIWMFKHREISTLIQSNKNQTDNTQLKTSGICHKGGIYKQSLPSNEQ